MKFSFFGTTGTNSAPMSKSQNTLGRIPSCPFLFCYSYTNGEEAQNFPDISLCTEPAFNSIALFL